MIHHLTPRRKSDALAARKKLVSVSPEADSTDGAGAGRQRLDVQQQRHHRRQSDGSSPSSSDDHSGSDSEEDDTSESDSDDDKDESHTPSSRSSTRQTSSSTVATTTTTTATLDRASIISSLRPNTNTDGLSDYELLRLQKIQRNEAKLASLGLCGITSKNHSGSGIGTNGTISGSGTNESSAKKAANTRRKNVAHAKKIMQLHHEQQQRTTHTSSHRSINYSTATAIPNPNSRIEQWKSRYSELQSFITTYGTYDVLTRSFENGKYKSLCGWWNRQRTQYTKYKFGSKSTLGEEQIRLLDNLNDQWRSSSSSTTRGVGRGGDGDGIVRGVGRARESGSGTKTAQRLWKASNSDSETEEDESTWERIQRDNDEDEDDDEGDDVYVDDDDVDESSTEEEEVDIDSVDSYSDQSTSDSVDDFSDGQHRNGATRRTNRPRGVVYPSGKSKTRTRQKRKRTSDSSRIRRSSTSGNRSIGGTGNRLTSTRTKRMRGSMANVSSLELIPPPATKVVAEDGKFASNNHRIERRARPRVKGRRVRDDRFSSSDEYDTKDEYEEEEDSISTMDLDENDRLIHRVVSPESRRYGHRLKNHRRYYRDHHRRHCWHRPVSEIVIPPSEEQYALEQNRYHSRHHHRRSFQHHRQQQRHDDYHHYHYRHRPPHHQEQQQAPQIIKEREDLLREYGQLYKRQCAIQDQKSSLAMEIQHLSREYYMIASSSGRSTSLPAIASSASPLSSSILAAYTATTTTMTTTATTSTSTTAAPYCYRLPAVGRSW